MEARQRLIKKVYKNKSPRDIFVIGRDIDGDFDYNEGLDRLIEAKNPEFIYAAGKEWPQFDYEKGLDALIKIGEAKHIYNAGLIWPHFNYEKGADALIKANDPDYINSAILSWSFEDGSCIDEKI